MVMLEVGREYVTDDTSIVRIIYKSPYGRYLGVTNRGGTDVSTWYHSNGLCELSNRIIRTELLLPPNNVISLHGRAGK